MPRIVDVAGVGRIPGEDAQRLERRQRRDDFLAQRLAEVAEIPAGAVIGEGQDRDGVLPDEGGADRPLRSGARFVRLEGRRVSTLRQLDDQLVGAGLLAVVAHQPRAQPARLHAHDRVGARVERRLLVEDLHADDVLLQLIAAAGDGLGDDEVEEPFEAIDLPERRAGEEALELPANGRVAGVRPRSDPGLTPAFTGVRLAIFAEW